MDEIGPAARGALPELARLTTFTNDWRARACAEAAVIKITGAGLSHLSQALQETSDQSKWFLNNGGNVILYLGTNAEPSLPLLFQALQQTNTDIQGRAIEIVVKTHAQPDKCIPIITPFLKSANSQVRESALDALGAFGTASATAVPEILELLKDTNGFVQGHATNALLHIDLSAALRAGAR